MWVYPGMSLPEPGTVIKIAGAGATQCKVLASKACASVKSGVINTGDVGSLERCTGDRDSVFGKDECCWVETQIGQQDWESLVKDNLQIPV